jgi:hypothetical protein
MSSSTRSSGHDDGFVMLRRSLVLVALLAAGGALHSTHAQPAGAASPRAPATAVGANVPMNAEPFITRYVADGRLAGEGRLNWLGFHVYDARLYATPQFSLADPATQPFVLELTYARKLEGKSIAEASRDEMQRLGLGSAAQHAQWLAQMEKLFPDVDKGRRIAGVNQPGVGARFYVDGRFVGSIDEPDFARAFFAIWLDPRTRAPRLRENLVKGVGPAAAL